MTEREPPLVEVSGDPTADWLIASFEEADPGVLHAPYQWEVRQSVEFGPVPGGAAMLSAVVEAAVRASDGPPIARVEGITVSSDILNNPGSEAITRTFSVWQPFPVRHGGTDTAWRLRQFLGQRPAPSIEGWRNRGPRTDPASILLLDDANLGFRDVEDAWRHILDGAAPAQIVVKMIAPLATGPLWRALGERFAGRLTLYCSAADLRKEFAPIGQPLSWERMGSDVVQAVRAQPRLAAVRVVVSLGLAGAIVVDPGGASLIFDPLHQEGDWERDRPGGPIGIGTCLMTGLSLAAAARPRAPDWSAGARSGLWAGRALHEGGYELADPRFGPGLRFPTERVAAAVRQGPPVDEFQTASIEAGDWRIFTAAVVSGYRQAAVEIARTGDREAFRGLPVERMAAWSSMDRTEIESMRSVRNISREYLSLPRRVRPLSLAVFGPPGSGKSFAIKQMAREWTNAPTKLAILEFNLSQFTTAEDLPVAQQRIRDCAVEETLPLVFWDEFDSAVDGRELGWLVRFLAPMQDGAFIEDGVVRPIGPAIFVFAGGTHATMASFKRRAVDLPEAKATDFLSRLRGYVDILGPNPADQTDETFMLRRALLIRALIRGRAPRLFSGERLNIDPGVLRAFLDVPTYVHGARSMEAIIDMSALTGRLRYERSALPARHQLDLHVDAAAFLELVDQDGDG